MSAALKLCLGAAVISFVATFSSPVSACIHPAEEDADLEASEYRAVVMYADEMQKIYLRPGVEMNGDDVEIAWVIPTPTRPKNVKLANLSFVNWVESELAIKKIRESRPKARSRSRRKNLEVGEPFEVGPYEMQSVQATGKEGATALAQWLESNGFGKLEGPILDYYVENGWSFTTVRSKLSAGDDEEQVLPPIMVEFATPHVVIPTRLMAAKHEILVKVWYITDTELEEDVFKHANRAFKLDLAPDRRKGSDWRMASKDWVLGRESVYTSQLENQPVVLDEIKTVYPESNRIWVYGLVGAVSPRAARRAKEDLFIAPRGTKLDMTEYSYTPPESAESTEADTGAAVAEGADAGATPSDKEDDAPAFVDEIPDGGDVNWTMILGVVALAFFGLMVLGVQIRRMR